MASQVSILIQAKDAASAAIDKVSGSLQKTGTTAETATSRVDSYQEKLGQFVGIGVVASTALYGIVKGVDATLTAATRYQNAMTGLSSIADAFGQDADKAKIAAQNLASDGLMTVSEAAGGLKNLLASGFGLDQAITLMTNFKDTASFNRQAALGFGEAIVSATEGIKNGNSILVDNAGVTKNLSVILEEAGFSAQDLMRATTDVNVRQALFNGLLKETKPMVGDAAKLASSFAGEQARLATATNITAQKIGTALQPALRGAMSAVTPLITLIGNWVSNNSTLVVGIVTTTAVLVALVAGIGILNTALAILGPLVTMVTGPIGLLGSLAALLIGGFAMLTTQTDKTSGAMDRNTTAAERLTEAQRGAKEAADSLNNAQLGEEGAALRAEGAQNRLNEATVQYGPNSYQARLAAFDLKTAQEELSKAHEATTAAVQSNTEKQNAVQTASAAVSEEAERRKKEALSRTNWAIEGQVTVLDTLSGKLSKLNGKVINYTVNGNYYDYQSKLKATGSGAPYAANALGTSYFSGGQTLVGEYGPEIVNLPQGSQVTPAYRTRSESAGDASGTTNNYLTGTFNFSTAASVQEFFGTLDKTQRLARMGMAA